MNNPAAFTKSGRRSVVTPQSSTDTAQKQFAAPRASTLPKRMSFRSCSVKRLRTWLLFWGPYTGPSFLETRTWLFRCSLRSLPICLNLANRTKAAPAWNSLKSSSPSPANAVPRMASNALAEAALEIRAVSRRPWVVGPGFRSACGAKRWRLRCCKIGRCCPAVVLGNSLVALQPGAEKAANLDVQTGEVTVANRNAFCNKPVIISRRMQRSRIRAARKTILLLTPLGKEPKTHPSIGAGYGKQLGSDATSLSTRRIAGFPFARSVRGKQPGRLLCTGLAFPSIAV